MNLVIVPAIPVVGGDNTKVESDAIPELVYLQT